jgi:hypothetical protein
MQITTWLIAKEDEAEAIESIVTTEERSAEDWSHRELPLGQLELMALSAALQGAEDITKESILEEPLVFREEDGLLIARVVDSFIQVLARVADERVPSLTEAWSERMDSEDHEPEELRDILSNMVSLAREAVARRSPVLSLSTF